MEKLQFNVSEKSHTELMELIPWKRGEILDVRLGEGRGTITVEPLELFP